jgi:hypothetical protein
MTADTLREGANPNEVSTRTRRPFRDNVQCGVLLTELLALRGNAHPKRMMLVDLASARMAPGSVCR